MEVGNATSSYSVLDNAKGIFNGAWDLMPWNFESTNPFCLVYQTAVAISKEAAYLGIKPPVPFIVLKAGDSMFRLPERMLQGALPILKVISTAGGIIAAFEALGDAACYGDGWMEKIGVVARSVSWNAARLVMKLTAPLDTFISVEPFAIALSYLNLKDRQQMHYTMNSKLETGDKGSIDLYAAFHNSIKAGDMVTLGLLVQKYKEKNPGKRIEFSTPAGVMDGLFLVVGTENPRLAAIQLFMETGCNPNSEYNGKTPLGILTDYQAKHSSLEVAHAVVYMQGMASLLEQHAKRQATGSITAAPAQQLAIGDSSKEVCHNPDGCIEDAPQE